jgi:hypothetical protein
LKTGIQIDFYTKFILTVIALCLIWICLRDVRLFPRLYASNPELVDVRIKAIKREVGLGWDPVSVEASANLPTEVRNTTGIPVEVKNALLAVDVKNVEVKGSLGPLDVKK